MTLDLGRDVQVTVLEVTQADIEGEPLGTLVSMISAAWEDVPKEYRECSGFEFTPSGGLRAWYVRPETPKDVSERLEFERLTEKLKRERRI